MKYAHTPGPWHMAPYWPSPEARKKLSPDHYVITTGKGEGYGKSLATANSEADARLIATAPDLLKVLLVIRYKIDNYDGEGLSTISWLADEAIARATGEK